MWPNPVAARVEGTPAGGVSSWSAMHNMAFSEAQNHGRTGHCGTPAAGDTAQPACQHSPLAECLFLLPRNSADAQSRRRSNGRSLKPAASILGIQHILHDISCTAESAMMNFAVPRSMLHLSRVALNRKIVIQLQMTDKSEIPDVMEVHQSFAVLGGTDHSGPQPHCPIVRGTPTHETRSLQFDRRGFLSQGRLQSRGSRRYWEYYS